MARLPPSRLFTAALVTALVFLGCATPDPSPLPDGATATVQRDGIRLTLTLEGVPISGARSWARVRVENLGTRAVVWAKALCYVPAAVSIDTTLATGLYIEDRVRGTATGNTILCPASLSTAELLPGAALQMRTSWSGTVDDAPAAPGPATVKASFAFIGFADRIPVGFIDPTPLVVEISTAVTVSPKAE
ncbi:MAG TPA: hypothetical protein VGC90_10165 [Candidatus Limnocylindrales bacterium]